MIPNPIGHQTGTSRLVRPILGLSCALMLVACHRAAKPAAVTESKTLEQRISDLEQQFGNSNAPSPSAQDLQKEAEHDLAEIRSLGLVDRAQRDFAERVPGAASENFRISYFMDTNLVWCSVDYTTQGTGESRRQEFGYKRVGSTNWNLIWEDNKR